MSKKIKVKESNQTIQQSIKAAKVKNLFTIISDDQCQMLLFEGKTIYCSENHDFHSGHDTAFFLKKEINKSWNTPKELLHICQSMIKTKTAVNEVCLDNVQIIKYAIAKDIYTTHDDFCISE